jgi:O-antigen ligase
MPAAGPARPALALAGLGAGLGLAAVLARLRGVAAVALVVGGVLGGCLAVAVVAGGVGDAARLVAETRITLASPDRSGTVGAALRVAAAHPLTGAGPGQADLRSRGADGGTRIFGYAHNEYAQVAAELGLVGLALLAVLLVALGRLLWRARRRPAGRGLGGRGRGDGSLRRAQRLRLRLAPASGGVHRDAAGRRDPPGARGRRCPHTVPHRSRKGVR